MPRGRGKETVRDVMSRYKRRELRSGSKHGPVVDKRDQAIAIALSEAGLSDKRVTHTGGRRGDRNR